MERVLQKLARQILAYDEASLSALWDQYAGIVQNFEPTKRWEEAVIVLGIIQSVRWKNQLFNYHWKEGTNPTDLAGDLANMESKPLFPNAGKSTAEGLENGNAGNADKRGKVLRFRAREDDETV